MKSLVQALLIVAATSFLSCLALVANAAQPESASTAFKLQKLDFDLADCKGSKQSSLRVLAETLKDPRLPETVRPKAKVEVVTQASDGTRRELYYIFSDRVVNPNKSAMGPQIEQGNEPRIMGMTAQQANLASREGLDMRACAPGHEQGDLSNRWCHTAISESAAEVILGKDGKPVLKALLGCAFWAPKEFLVDMNPSAHDISCTYRDKLGTKRSVFEVNVYGDALFDNHMRRFKPFSGSTPFITWRRALGPQPRD